MSESFPGGEGEHQHAMVDGVTSAGGVCLPFYHVPQQSRREKLRYPNSHDSPAFNSQASTSSSPPFFHCHPHGNPSFAFPCSSSYQLLNEYGGVPSFNLLEHHSFYEGAAQNQAIHGVSLSLSSSVVSPSHHTQQEHLIGAASMGGVSARMEPVPAGPFTGYATILKVSRFLRPTQQMLEEVCGGASAGGLTGGFDDIETLGFTADCVGAAERNLDETMSGEQRRMKTRLVSLLEEVCRRYRLYFQQIQAVISSFEAVAGLNMAAPYTPLAVKTLTKHFKCLKDAIVYQLRFVNESGRDGMNKDEISGHNRFMVGGLGFQRAASGAAPISQQPAWRPQRGLPERAVAVLRSWLFEHFLHPYPTDMDKQMLAKQTGLSRSQVSNWFINARVRLWKPMVEEIHSLEQRRRVSPESDDKPADPSSSSFSSPASEQTQNKYGSSSRKNHEQRFQSELVEIAGGQVAAPVGYNVDVPMAGVVAGGHAGVSLTLGLHQNNAYCLPEQIPLNVARRFGLEDGYVMGGFEGKEFDGQLLRDSHFVA